MVGPIPPAAGERTRIGAIAHIVRKDEFPDRGFSRRPPVSRARDTPFRAVADSPVAPCGETVALDGRFGYSRPSRRAGTMLRGYRRVRRDGGGEPTGAGRKDAAMVPRTRHRGRGGVAAGLLGAAVLSFALAAGPAAARPSDATARAAAEHRRRPGLGVAAARPAGPGTG